MMGKKYRIDCLEQTRNKYSSSFFMISLPLASLGDKPYKNPDYCKDYFKEGGLIPGANIATKKVNSSHLFFAGEFEPALGERNGAQIEGGF
jgi:hypothetical protein